MAYQHLNLNFDSSEALRAALATLTLACGPIASAWEPVTHVFLAQRTIEELVKPGSDGKLSFYLTDYVHGGLLRDGAGQLILIGRYDVDPAYLSAIRNYRGAYVAGACGPDLFPDIVTGQEMIRPARRSSRIGADRTRRCRS